MKFLYVQSAVLLYPYGAALLAGQDRRALSSVFVYHLCYVRVYLEQITRTAFGSKTAHYLLSHLEKHRLSRYHPAAPVAVRACGLQYVAYTLSGLLAGHFHKAELRYAEHVGLGAVLAQLLLEGFYDLFLSPDSSISMKSIIIMPLISRRRSCRAISLAASQLVAVMVS